MLPAGVRCRRSAMGSARIHTCLPPHTWLASRPTPAALPSRSNLVFLKRYEGDVADLNLSFTITDDVLGKAHEVSACCACWGARWGSCFGARWAACGSGVLGLEGRWCRCQWCYDSGQQSALSAHPPTRVRVPCLRRLTWRPTGTRWR